MPPRRSSPFSNASPIFPGVGPAIERRALPGEPPSLYGKGALVFKKRDRRTWGGHARQSKEGHQLSYSPGGASWRYIPGGQTPVYH
jgi:hypothetical protein